MLIKEIDKETKDDAINTIFHSFKKYPVIRYILGDDSYNDENVYELIRFFIESRLIRGHELLGIIENGKIVCAAGIDSPVDGPWPEELDKLFNNLQEKIGSRSINRLKSYEKLISEILPDRDFHYLGFIGVHPDYQGKGYAKTLISEITRRISECNLSNELVLNTEDYENVGIYNYLGFDLIGSAPIDNMTTWCMNKLIINEK